LKFESKENKVRSKISKLKSEKEQQLKLKTELAEIEVDLAAAGESRQLFESEKEKK
jgi:chromosome segregation protein